MMDSLRTDAAVTGAVGSRRFSREWVLPDVIAGLTSAAVVVPTAAYALLGTSRPLSVSSTKTLTILAASAVLALASWAVRAQEIEPRAYSPSPVGLNFLTLSMTRSSGGVAVDPTLPIDDVDATINTANVGYQRTFALLGRTASAGLTLPYAWGEVSGDVFEERQSVTRSGLADARLRFAVSLYGGPAVSRQEFAAQTRSTQIGASVLVVAPTGEYDSSKLINLGSNCWAAKPEIGWYQPLGQWTFKLAAGMWIFGDNPDFYGGVRREQEPVTSV